MDRESPKLFLQKCGLINMDLIKLINKYKNKILDDSILIEYDLFFNNLFKENCKFVFDNDKELKELNDVILEIKKIDKNAEIYVNTYGINFKNKRIFIYADTLWIDTIVKLDEIFNIFRGFSKIEPSSIVSLDIDETIDGTISLVFSLDGSTEDYESFIRNRRLSKIKSLYWD
ncbi:MAG: hypothetical protein HFH66_12425 [Lachnospiraceae bacterium]|jgi:hypothetical protein|uniref:hypothetical protein n=2 Tax=uncultured Clostridium sp. TaxID=59620 RepID=UPI00272E65E6|nr:hypothetical protein [uncultured Clostridium sp.]MCI8752134.1 hypothetical protein [Lachnospiraceae bacterium]